MTHEWQPDAFQPAPLRDEAKGVRTTRGSLDDSSGDIL